MYFVHGYWIASSYRSFCSDYNVLTYANKFIKFLYDGCHVENEIEKQHKKCIKEDHLTLKKVECINQG